MKVTVTIPLFNKAAFISECISSVLSQDYSDFTLIVIDDVSTDNSIEIVKSFNDPRLKLVKNEVNFGTAKNGNRCFDLAEEGIMIRQDADDVMAPERISRQVNLLRANPNVAVITGKNKRLNSEHHPVASLSFQDLKNEIYFTNPYSQPTAAFNLDVLNKTGVRYWEEGPSIGEDWILFYQICKESQILSVNEVFNYYRINETNISNPNTEKYHQDIISVLRFLFTDLKMDVTELELKTHLLFRKTNLFESKLESLIQFDNWSDRLIFQNKMHPFIMNEYLIKKIEEAQRFLFFDTLNDEQAASKFKKLFGHSFRQKLIYYKSKFKK